MCSCKFPSQVVWRLYSAVTRVTHSLLCLGAVRNAASRLLNSLCDLNSSQSMTQVPWLNRATGFALGAHALQWAGLTLALAWLEWGGPTSGNSKIFQKAFGWQRLGAMICTWWRRQELTSLHGFSKGTLHTWYCLCSEGQQLCSPASPLNSCCVASMYSHQSFLLEEGSEPCSIATGDMTQAPAKL